jgi:hypothetical protein
MEALATCLTVEGEKQESLISVIANKDQVQNERPGKIGEV